MGFAGRVYLIKHMLLPCRSGWCQEFLQLGLKLWCERALISQLLSFVLQGTSPEALFTMHCAPCWHVKSMETEWKVIKHQLLTCWPCCKQRRNTHREDGQSEKNKYSAVPCLYNLVSWPWRDDTGSLTNGPFKNAREERVRWLTTAVTLCTHYQSRVVLYCDLLTWGVIPPPHPQLPSQP